MGPDFFPKLLLLLTAVRGAVLTVLAQPLTTTLIDFEDQPPRTSIHTEYSRQGVLFPRGAFVDADPAAYSGTRVLRAGDPANEFHQGPLLIEFTSPQNRVQFVAGTTLSTTQIQGTLRAYGVDGALIAQDGPKPVAPKVFTTPFEVSAPTPSIVRIELEMPPSEFEAIDNLELTGLPPGALPTTAPAVRIILPTDGAQLDITGALPIEGTVTGAGVPPTATLTVKALLPPESSAPPFKTALPLAGSDPARTFSQAIALRFLGPLTLTVEAENSAGKGRAEVHIVNLLESIRSRYSAAGGASVLGNFRFGIDDGSCRMAVYERGLISSEASTTRLVTGPIFTKWFALRDSTGASLIACPMAEERDALAGARAQDFRKGRIYAGLPTGAHYVPTAFAVAIDRLGGEIATGLPVADPQSSVAADAWLFQQFGRPGQPGLLSTLELRGSPPTLLVERPGGDLSELAEAGLQLSDSTATIWQQFPCDGQSGPCNVAPPRQQGGISHEDAERLCEFTTYPWGPPEWKNVLANNYVLSQVEGFVKSAEVSGSDNPLAHEYSNDWDMSVRPLPAYRNLLAGDQDFLEIEYEVHFSTHLFATYHDQPVSGDLLFAAGRWIIDCGHADYHAEIHPPFVVAWMRTEEYQGKPATAAYLWVNGFYPGDPVEVDICPPPRPSPEASLVIVKPMDAEAAVGITVQTPSESLTHAIVRFSASPRFVNVTDAGEMQWQTGRGYEGKWYVFWHEP